MSDTPSEIGTIPANVLDAVNAFTKESPYEKNVFVMMRYRDGEQFSRIELTIRQALSEFGLRAHFAKDRAWLEDLWQNLCVYMNGCKYGIAVFEEIDERSFNPNIALELGYMYALGRRCLILKDKRMPTLPTDVVGKLYKPIDTYDIGRTVWDQVSRWLEIDLKLIPIPREGIPYVVWISGSSYVDDTKPLCNALGIALAKQGYRIASGGGPGAGLDVARSAYEYLVTHRPALSETYVTLVCTPKRKATLVPFGRIVDVADVQTLHQKLIEMGWGYIFIGGDKGTREEYEMLKRHKLQNPRTLQMIIPIGCAGGTARRIWTELAQSANEPDAERISSEDFTVLNDEHADVDTIVAVVMRILNEERRAIH